MTADPTIQSLLRTPGLRLRLVAGEQASLERPIRWVHSTELARPGPYLRGGELICTVGVLLTDPAACATFVRSVAAAGAVGVCFGSGDVHPDTPTALVEACLDAALPLLELPSGAPFIALSEHLADQWVRAGSMVAAQGEQVVARMLEALSGGASVAELLALAGAAAAGQVHVVAGRGGPLHWTGPGEPPPADLLVQLGRVVAVAQHEVQVAARRRRVEVGHLLSLLAAQVADARAVAPAVEAAGLAGHPLLVVRAFPSADAETVLSSLPPAALVGELDETLLAVTAATDVGTAASGPCGVSASVDHTELGRGVVQARAALHRAISTGGGVVRPRDLAGLEALLDHVSDDALAPFVDQLVTPLVAADRRHGTSQLQTLRLFLGNDGSLRRTAQQQFLHVNTVRHRLDRIRQVTGRNPLQLHDLIAFAVALAAHDRAAAGSGS